MKDTVTHIKKKDHKEELAEIQYAKDVMGENCSS